MDPTLRIRPAKLKDVGAVSRLLVETWHDTFDDLLGPERVREITERWHAEEVLARQLDSQDGTFLVAELAGQVVGHALGDAPKPPPPLLMVYRLYVRPAFQRRGIGGALLAALVRRHPETDRIRLLVEADNVKGRAFYARNGFVAAGEVMEGGLRAFRMEKTLDRGGAR
jgi:ribosomal protein S18 acetylase RimI-like enzyme